MLQLRETTKYPTMHCPTVNLTADAAATMAANGSHITGVPVTMH